MTEMELAIALGRDRGLREAVRIVKEQIGSWGSMAENRHAAIHDDACRACLAGLLLALIGPKSNAKGGRTRREEFSVLPDGDEWILLNLGHRGGWMADRMIGAEFSTWDLSKTQRWRTCEDALDFICNILHNPPGYIWVPQLITEAIQRDKGVAESRSAHP